MRIETPTAAPFEGEIFEEVGKVVQGVPGADEVGRLPAVLVGEEPAPHALDVIDCR